MKLISHPDFVFGRHRPLIRPFEVAAARLTNRMMFAVTKTELVGNFDSLPPDAPVLFVANHPRLSDPPSFYAIGPKVPRLVYTVASRKLFDEGMGLLGMILKNIRCISIQRRAADLPAFKAMSQLLTQPKNALLVYPETEVAYGFHHLFPFQTGLFQLALGAEARSKAGLSVVPLGFTYRVTQLNPDLIVQRLETIVERTGARDSMTDLIARAEQKLIGEPLAKAEALVAEASELVGKPRSAWKQDPLVAAHQVESHAESIYGSEPQKSQKYLAAKEAEKLSLRAIACVRYRFIPPVESGEEAIADRVEQLEYIAYGKAKMKTIRTSTISVGEPLSTAQYLGDAAKPTPEQAQALCEDARNAVARLIGFQQ